jgi:hypothetical protein
VSFPLYFDEDQDERIAIWLRRDGYDVLTTKDAGRAHVGLSDENQLQFAASVQRAIVTNNQSDFVPLFRRWWEQDLHHSGVIVINPGRPSRKYMKG